MLALFKIHRKRDFGCQGGIWTDMKSKTEMTSCILEIHWKRERSYGSWDPPEDGVLPLQKKFWKWGEKAFICGSLSPFQHKRTLEVGGDFPPLTPKWTPHKILGHSNLILHLFANSCLDIPVNQTSDSKIQPKNARSD